MGGDPNKHKSCIAQKATGMNFLTAVLESQNRVGFRDIVTGGESLFPQPYDHWPIWRASADELPKRVAHTIAAQKHILTVFLGSHGTDLVNWFPPGGKSNVADFCEKTLEPLSEVLHIPQGRYGILTILHVIGQFELRIVLKVANSNMLPNLRAALISVYAASFHVI
jgi:hypothetical protein